LKNVFTTSIGITYTTCHLHGIKETLVYVKVFKTRKPQVHPLLNILTLPDWLNVKFHYVLIGPKVKIFNTLTPLAPIYVMLFPVS